MTIRAGHWFGAYDISDFWYELAVKLHIRLCAHLPAWYNRTDLHVESDWSGVVINAANLDVRYRQITISRYFDEAGIVISFYSRTNFLEYNIKLGRPKTREQALETILSHVVRCIETWLIHAAAPGTHVGCGQCPNQLKCLTEKNIGLSLAPASDPDLDPN